MKAEAGVDVGGLAGGKWEERRIKREEEEEEEGGLQVHSVAVHSHCRRGVGAAGAGGAGGEEQL